MWPLKNGDLWHKSGINRRVCVCVNCLGCIVLTTLYLTRGVPWLQIKKRDEEITRLQEESRALKSNHRAASDKAQVAEKAREALQTEYKCVVEELKSHEEAMASLKEKVEEEERERAEELEKCARVIEELKEQLREAEQQRAQQQRKVKVTMCTGSKCV